ncbi:hypothetical protein IscW_ISCW014199 [Ixodes scapularis]|uniref:Uncharacterized protein n=1 Tax=Ixodes scapularis TaxID=6945 RepID=B7QI41_IXOSC|nr:hypothetical protein IscW_ISCW014199 [Ixodes scapularis]|eukprot:XP_002414848.1 hypothetical protein IscW_ISCW014199 [Ixodes scapularis]
MPQFKENTSQPPRLFFLFFFSSSKMDATMPAVFRGCYVAAPTADGLTEATGKDKR